MVVVGGSTVVVGGVAVVGGGQLCFLHLWLFPFPFPFPFPLFPSLSLEWLLALVNKQGDVTILQLTDSQEPLQQPPP